MRLDSHLASFYVTNYTNNFTASYIYFLVYVIGDYFFSTNPGIAEHRDDVIYGRPYSSLAQHMLECHPNGDHHFHVTHAHPGRGFVCRTRLERIKKRFRKI